MKTKSTHQPRRVLAGPVALSAAAKALIRTFSSNDIIRRNAALKELRKAVAASR